MGWLVMDVLLLPYHSKNISIPILKYATLGNNPHTHTLKFKYCPIFYATICCRIHTKHATGTGGRNYILNV